MYKFTEEDKQKIAKGEAEIRAGRFCTSEQVNRKIRGLIRVAKLNRGALA